MSEADAMLLDRALSAFLAAKVPFGSGSRVISSADDDGVLALLLREIDETLLPRRLLFEVETGDVLELDVADRHVLFVAATQGAWTKDLPARIGGTALADATGDDVTRLGAALVGFTTGRRSLLVRSEWGIASGKAGAVGISVQTLKETLAGPPVAAGTARVAPVIDLFMGRIGSISIATLLVEQGSVVHSSGGLAQLRALQEILGEIENAEKGLDTGPDQMISLSSGYPGGPCSAQDAAILCASSGDRQLLIWLDGADMVSAAAHWISAQADSDQSGPPPDIRP